MSYEPTGSPREFATKLEARARELWGTAVAVAFGEYDPGTSPISDPSVERSLSSGERQVLSTIKHPGRQAEWVAARNLERQVLRVLQAAPSFDLSRARTSVSHSTFDSRGVVVCAGMLASAPSEGIGIDLESESRTMKPEVRSWLVRPSEEPFLTELSVLDLWMIKEACFKAHSPNAGLVLSQFEVRDWNGAQGNATGPGGVGFRFFVAGEGGWKVALANRLPSLG